MSDNLVDVQYDLLLKDVALLANAAGPLPASTLDPAAVESEILLARRLLAPTADGE